MSRETVARWCENTISRRPKPTYRTGPTRFGPDGYDCSGFTYMAYKADGKTVPADTASLARWGRTNNQVRSVGQARLCDFMIHDRYGDPYNSGGPRGHVGLFVRASGGRVITYESAGSGQGVGIYSRAASFWAISVQHPAFALTGQTSPPQPVPVPEDEMYRIIKGDVYEDRWVTNWLEKRHVGKNPGFDAEAKAERDAIIKAGVTGGFPEIVWPQAWVENIPVKTSDT